ncbi:MAG TPA: NADPH-dependent FMN reductase [Longilinea sp.]|nr:NADPH-dependent FMN reductase [Longilinea sp.]
MAETLKVLGISGSLRKGSYNTALLHEASRLLPKGMTLEIHDLASIPLYNADLDSENPPEAVKQLRDHIRAADALLIATPEYNYSIPGVLKNAIDWASRPVKDSALNGKPLAIMGAGGLMGTSRAQSHLRQVAVFTNMFPLNKPEIFVTYASQKFDANGNLTDEVARQLIKDMLVALANWTHRLKAGV